MRKLGTTDHLLLLTLLPVWVLVFGLHVRGAFQDGLLETSVVAAPASRVGSLPTIGAFRLELPRPEADLRIGDRVRAVGDRPGRSLGYLSFQAAMAGEAGTDHSVQLRLEREGRLHAVSFPLTGPVLPWSRIPVLAASVLAAVVMLLRAPRADEARLAFAAIMALAIFQTPFPGPSYEQTLIHLTVFHASGGLALGLVGHWMSRFPSELASGDRVPGWLPWVVGLAWYLPRSANLAGGPAFSYLPVVAALYDAGFILFLIGLWVRSYRRVGPIGRRRFKWVVYAMGFAGLPLLGIGAAAAIPGMEGLVPALLASFAVAMLALPIAMLIAIVRFNLLDIDRLLSTSASWGILLAAGVAGITAVVPRASQALGEGLGLSRTWASTLAALGVAGVLVPAGMKLRPALDRVMRREQIALEGAMGRLTEDLACASTPADVARLLGERLDALVRPECCAVFADAGGHHPAVFWRSEREPLVFESGGTLLAALGERSAPLSLAPVGWRRAHALPDSPDRRALAEMGARLVLPLRRDPALAGFVVLGRKRSGDVYTSTDEALLAAVAAKAGDVLLRFEHAELIAEAGERELQLRAETRTAHEENEAKTRFLASASHDLRQPLYALGLLLDGLVAKLRDAETLPLALQAQRATRGMEEMFEAILDISRLDAGATRVNPTQVRLGPLLQQLVADLQPEAVSRGLTLRAVPTGAIVRSDPVMLRRIFQNLVVNALRYTERGGVLVGARRTAANASIRVEVWDTGPGIREDEQAAIFREYERRSGGRAGLGLGLAIVRRFTDLLGHELSLASRPGRGSVFRVTLPRVHRAPEGEGRFSPGPSIPLPFAGRSVLVCTSDEGMREALVGWLTKWGCRVEVRGHASDAGAGDATLSLDVAFLDEQIGGAGSAEALQAAGLALQGQGVPCALLVENPGLRAAETRNVAPWSEELLILSRPLSAPRLRAALAHLMRVRDGTSPPTVLIA